MTNERERALANAHDDEERRHALVEYLNFLELYAAALNGRLLVEVAREVVTDKVMDSLLTIQRAPEWHGEIENAVSSESTFSHLCRFIRYHRHTMQTRVVR